MEKKENLNLPAIIEKSGISTEQALLIEDQFKAFLEQTKKWKEDAFKVVITSIDQKFEIAEATKAYKIVKELRIETEKRRVDLKADSLKKGKLIDSIANFVFEELEPIEEHLEKQAKFVKMQEEKAKVQMMNERIELLTPYVADLSIFNLTDMPQDTFDTLLANSKESWKEAEAKKKAEEEAAFKKTEADRIENERIRTENEKLKKEQAQQEAELAKERKANEAREKMLKDAQEAERIAREKIEAELRAQQEAELAKEKAEAEKQRKLVEAKEKAERDAKMAPDKEKLAIYAEAIKNVPAPTGVSVAALEIVKVAQEELLKVSQKVKDNLKNL